LLFRELGRDVFGGLGVKYVSLNKLRTSDNEGTGDGEHGVSGTTTMTAPGYS
jgi:hypothetical protein